MRKSSVLRSRRNNSARPCPLADGKHPTSNSQHRTPKERRPVSHWMLGVRCWMLDVPNGSWSSTGWASAFSLEPAGANRGNPNFFQLGAFSPLTRPNSGVSVIRLMRFSNAGQFVPVKFAEPRQPSVFSPYGVFSALPLALSPVGSMVFQADETQAGNQSVPCECPIASPAHFFFAAGFRRIC
jgi:hypothetical protein